MRMKRSASAAVIVTALAGTAAVATATPAAAASYQCTSQDKSIDDPSYSGPWPDNWNVTVTVCAKRSGTTVYSYAKITWSGAERATVDDTSIFDDAYFKVQIKKSQSGTDPVKKSANFGAIEAKMENSNSSGDYKGSYTTGTISYKIGSSKGLGDGELHLNWNNDGAGDRNYGFKASPVV